MKKLKIVGSLFFVVIISIIFFVGFTQSQYGYDNPNLPKIPSPEVKVITFNNNSGAVNSSEIWITIQGDMDNIPDLFPTLNESYVRRDGSTPLTADWDAGSFVITQEAINLTSSLGFLVFDSKGINPVTFSISGLAVAPSTIKIQPETSTLATLQLTETITGVKTFSDNTKQIFGSSNKVSFFHDGTDFFLDLQESITESIFKIINGDLQLNKWCGVNDANTCWQLSDTGNDEAKLKVGGDEAIFCDEVSPSNVDTCNWGAGFEQNNIGSASAGSNSTILSDLNVSKDITITGDLLMYSPNGTLWTCGVNNTGGWNCI